jgi:hypothetical protein
MKVETDIITSVAVSLIGCTLILVIMYVIIPHILISISRLI